MKKYLVPLFFAMFLALGWLSVNHSISLAQDVLQICYVDDTATGLNDGTSWTNAFVDLQSALAAGSGCTEVRVAAGVYKPTSSTERSISFQLRSGVSVLGQYPNGGGDVRAPANTTTLSGDINNPGDNTDNSYHVVNGSGVDATGLLDGFTITMGYASTPSADGGGVYVTDGSPTLSNLIIDNNYATGNGGGVYLNNSSAAMSDSIIRNNYGATGGGLYANGTGTPTLSNVTINNNTTNTNGAGAYVSNDVSFTDVTFQANTARSRGGGLYIASGNANLSNSNFTSNQASNGASTGYGGGVYVAGGVPTFTGVTFQSNKALRVGGAGGEGGGMYVSNSSPILSTTGFDSNTADSIGAGLFLTGSSADLDNVTFTNNTAGPGLQGGYGGGIYITGAATPTLTNVTFTSNKAQPQGTTGGKGGGIYNDSGSPDLDSVTFDQNTAGTASGMGGGGMYIVAGAPTLDGVTFDTNTGYDGAGLWSQGNPVIGTSTFSGNTANHYGGGIYIGSGSPSLTGSTVYGNHAVDGGGLWTQSSLTISGSTIEGNVATNNGGGVYTSQSITFSTSTVKTNQATNSGGGLYLLNEASSLTSVIINLNSASIGGGAALENSNAEFTDCNFDANTVTAQGAGMYVHLAAPKLTRVNFDSNLATSGPGTQQGGGLHIYSASPLIVDSTFTNNSAKSEGGGAFNNLGSPILRNPTFKGNQGSFGGGMYSYKGSVTIENGTFGNNQAEYGGGYATYDSPTIIRGCNVTGNLATRTGNASEGGGLWVEAPLTLTNCVLDGNTADIFGGGLYLNDAGPNTIINLIAKNNTLTQPDGVGGGIFSGHNGVFTNLLLTGNSAYRGGGFANYDRTVTIDNATIYDNSASDMGSAIYTLGGDRTISNSIIWGNGGMDILDEWLTSSTVKASILQNGCPVEYNDYPTLNPTAISTCTGILIGDPLFMNPASGNLQLQPSSPAIDAGDNSMISADSLDLDQDNRVLEPIPWDMNRNPRVVIGKVDLGAYEAQLWNTNWTEAFNIPLDQVQPDVYNGSIDRYIDQSGQSRWFKFEVEPDSKVIVTLTGLSQNYDLTLYKDIAEAYDQLSSPQDLVQLSAEFAPDTFSPDTFSPDTFSPDTFSPDTFSPDTFSPDTFSPDTFSPDTFSPDTFSPDTFSPDTFSPDTFSPDTFSPDTFSPDTFSPDTFSPDTFSPDTFSPDTFSSAQTRSMIAVSSHEGNQGEGIIINTWTKSGEFYVRIKGRNGAYDLDSPFHLQVTMLSGSCGSVSPFLPASDTQISAGGFHTLILTNLGLTEGTSTVKSLLQTKLAQLASRTNGRIIDIGADAQVSAAANQAQANPACVYAMNLQAGAIKNIADNFREANPALEYVVLVGNDHAIPFFRYTDAALLASEMDYNPPVKDDTTSQASLKSGYILSQDAYGAGREVSYKAGSLPIPDLAVGRLVETAEDINHVLDAYLGNPTGVVTPVNALVTGYDFLEDSAKAVRTELQGSLGDVSVDSLIMDSSLSPLDSLAWTATDLRNILLTNRHDLLFLAGHFSATSALAADFQTRVKSSDLLGSTTDFTNSLIYSIGCHSGYNIVNADDVPGVTEEPDWAQVFAQKGATFIGGTGYQYGDTDFIEYSERLYLEFTRQLRYGSGPIPVGKALVWAKQAYLASTPLMRGIHEKSVLEATLFGLPMMKYDLPGRISSPDDSSVITETSLFPSDPGVSLGLKYADLHLTPSFVEHTVTLDVASGGSTSTVDASYLEGPDGITVNPGEPVLPLYALNVTAPQSNYVLRGAGWRGGEYTDIPDKLPLTGAATEDIRAAHVAFFTDVFYPIRPWNINYFEALSENGGATRLALLPAQYRSASQLSMTGVWREFTGMDFRLYYSQNINTYSNPDANWSNTPALSSPPDISRIVSTDNGDGSVGIEVTVTGDPAAGIQEVWLVYNFENGATNGTWIPLDLSQDANDSRAWRGRVDLAGEPAGKLRFVVQAVNGVGVVTMMTNEGNYYRTGVDAAVPNTGTEAISLQLDSPATMGVFGGQQTLSAVASKDGTPVGEIPVVFNLGGQERVALTGWDGVATVKFFLVSQPGVYDLSASFAGNESYSSAADSSTFEIVKASTSVNLTPGSQTIQSSENAQFSAVLSNSGLPMMGKPVALTISSVSGPVYSNVAITDLTGSAHWSVPLLPRGTYTVKAWFGLPVSTDLDLTSLYYEGSSSTAALVVYEFKFEKFLQPVDNLPIMNKVKAGSAVPVKFKLGGDFGLSIFAPGYPVLKRTACTSGTTDQIESTVTAGASSLTYDSLTGIYTYVWKTNKSFAGSCGTLVFHFIDGTEATAFFQFTK